jgi:predicted HTH domain antitoxin
MTLTITLPEDVERSLRQRLGDGLDAAAREAMAVELYRQSLISHGQFAGLLGLSRAGADEVLKRHGVVDELSPEELDAQISSLRSGSK